MSRSSRSRRPLAAVVGGGLSMSLVACGGVTDGTAGDDEYPTDPITLTVGQEAGGSTDLIARAVSEGAQDALGVAMPVENQPGANGAIATQDVANQSPDGYELVLLNASLITITSQVVAEEEAVTLDDLDVIMGLSRDDYIMVANPDTGYESVDDVIDASGNITYGTTGVGTGSQLAQLLFFGEADIDGNEVPFDSGAPALTAVMGGQVDISTVQVGEAMPQIDAGTVTPIMVFSEDRNEYLADVPTALELGYDVPVAQYRALAMPAGAPEEVLQTLREGLEEIVGTEEYRQLNEEHYLTPEEISGAEVEEKWTELTEQYTRAIEENEIDLGQADE